MVPVYDILVANHDATVADWMTEVLVDAGYRVLSCLPSALTVEGIALLQPELLITELRPRTAAHTLGLFAQLRQHPHLHTCALLVTTSDRRLLTAMQPQLHTLGCPALVKPYPLAALLAHAAQAHSSVPQARSEMVTEEQAGRHPALAGTVSR